MELQQDRDYFVQKFERTKYPGDGFIARCMIRKARLEVRKAKSRYYHDQLILHKQNPRKCWRILSEINRDAKSEIGDLSYERPQGKIPERQLAEEINNYFVDIGERLANMIKHVNEKDNIYSALVNEHRFDLDETCQKEVLTKIRNLSPIKHQV